MGEREAPPKEGDTKRGNGVRANATAESKSSAMPLSSRYWLSIHCGQQSNRRQMAPGILSTNSHPHSHGAVELDQLLRRQHREDPCCSNASQFTGSSPQP